MAIAQISPSSTLFINPMCSPLTLIHSSSSTLTSIAFCTAFWSNSCSHTYNSASFKQLILISIHFDHWNICNTHTYSTTSHTWLICFTHFIFSPITGLIYILGMHSLNHIHVTHNIAKYQSQNCALFKSDSVYLATYSYRRWWCCNSKFGKLMHLTTLLPIAWLSIHILRVMTAMALLEATRSVFFLTIARWSSSELSAVVTPTTTFLGL